MQLRNYISASVKSCKFIRVYSVTEISDLLNFSLKSRVAVKKEGLANAFKGEHLFMCYLYCLQKEPCLIFVSQNVFVSRLTSFPVYHSYKIFSLPQNLFCNWQWPI